jgi:hypothetical protein
MNVESGPIIKAMDVPKLYNDNFVVRSVVVVKNDK